LHFNKGLAGAAPEIIEAASNTAMNPAVLDAFALAISGAEGPPAFPGIPGHEPDIVTAHQHARAVGEAMAPLRALLASAGSYVAEADYFEKAWQQSFWGPNYPRLLAVKDKYDPDGLFMVHHGVGSERWTDNGFMKI
jgi:FAD/FMN-containing dehydrogenase